MDLFTKVVGYGIVASIAIGIVIAIFYIGRSRGRTNKD